VARSATFFRGQGLRALLAAAALTALAGCAPNLSAPPSQTQAPVGAPMGPIVAEPLPDAYASPERETSRVALLVPLTGQGAEMGQAMLNAAQLALFDVAGDTFELLPRDTRGTPQGAAAAARDAIASGANLIIGPLFSSSVASVRPVAQQARIPVLAFSNDWTQAGENVWVLGLAPQEQVRRVVGYAQSQGLRRFGALVPRTPYGEAVAISLGDAAARQGGQVVRVERYDQNAADLTPTVRSLAGAGPAAYDAVMLPEGGQRLLSVAPMLPLYELDPQRVKLLGTGQWDEPTTGREPTLVGGWYAAPDPSGRSDFEERYEEFYGARPPRLATLAYDAAALAGRLAQFGAAGFQPDTLTDPSGFRGMDGIFRLLPGGAVERGLAVLEVTPEGPRIVDPAPASFELLLQ
jgi:branched-chain amino acid transport system substrate-binding protein